MTRTIERSPSCRLTRCGLPKRVREMPEQYFWAHKRFKTRPPGEPSPYDPSQQPAAAGAS